jgi:hypothetical protein
LRLLRRQSRSAPEYMQSAPRQCEGPRRSAPFPEQHMRLARWQSKGPHRSTPFPRRHAIRAPTIVRRPLIRAIPAVTRPTSAPTLHFPAMTIATRAGAFANCRAPIPSRTTVRDIRDVGNRAHASTGATPTPTPPCTGPTIDFPAPTLRIPGPPIDFPPPTHRTCAPIRQTGAGIT